MSLKIRWSLEGEKLAAQVVPRGCKLARTASAVRSVHGEDLRSRRVPSCR